jgi:hypothetical protein
MRSIALVALFVLAVGTGCASQRTRSTYVARAPAYAPSASYSSYTYSTRSSCTPRAAPVYGSSYGRRVTYASRVPPPPPPPPLYSTYRAPAPVRTVAVPPRPAAPRSTVTYARRPAPPAAVPVKRARTSLRTVPHKGCVTFVGGFAGILPPSSCST